MPTIFTSSGEEEILFSGLCLLHQFLGYLHDPRRSKCLEARFGRAAVYAPIAVPQVRDFMVQANFRSWLCFRVPGVGPPPSACRSLLPVLLWGHWSFIWFVAYGPGRMGTYRIPPWPVTNISCCFYFCWKYPPIKSQYCTLLIWPINGIMIMGVQYTHWHLLVTDYSLTGARTILFENCSVW